MCQQKPGGGGGVGMWWWWCAGWAVVCGAAAGAGGACAPLCHCRGDHLSCSHVSFHLFPTTEAVVRHVSVSGARLGTLGEAALDARPLRTLVLVASRLHHIDRNALQSMTHSLASLDLSYNEFTELPIEALQDLKVLNWLNLQNNFIGELDPKTEWGSLCDSLSSLSLSNNRLVSLQGGTFSSLRQLVQLDLEGNRLHAVAGGAVPPSLALLRLSDNLLEQVPCAALVSLPRLRHLHLRSNMLRDPLNATCHADRLKIDYLDLSQNEIDDHFTLNFHHRLQLKQLVLDLNDFTSVPSFVVDCGRLQKLSMSYNKLGYVSDATLHALKRDLERLELDHNELRSVPGSVRELTRLRHLSLSYNRLEELDYLPAHLHSLSLAGNYFLTFPSGLRQLADGTLIYLDLGYNHISSISAREFGAWSNALATLNLKGNRISQVSAGAFPASLPLRELILSFNDLYYVEADAFLNLTMLQMLELSSTLFSGEFPASTGLNRVTWLSLDNNDIHYVAPGDLENFLSLEYLNLDFNKLIEFPSDMVTVNASFRLKEVRLSYNYVVQLNCDFIKKLFELQSFDISFNRLHNISELCFSKLHRLEYLSVAGNLLEVIAPRAFHRLPRLVALDLQNNKLSEFSTNYFEGVSSEESNFAVNVSYNHITSLIGGSAVLLNVLDLSHNFIQILSKMFFECMASHIRQIVLSYNNITNIDNTSFGTLPQLQILSLNNNNISILKKRAFAELTQLQILDLSCNKILQLSVEQFHGLRQLRHLRLNANELRSLPRDCFRNTVVEHLDLSDNNITIFPSSSLAQIGFTLRRLEVARNRLEYLDAAMFYTIAFLHELSLAYNSLTVLADNTFAGLTRLTHLDLSYNQIKTNFKELFHNVPRLRQLLLAGVSLRAVPHLPLANLTELDLSLNHIASYREADVRRLTALRTLHLAGNRFTSLQPAMWAALPRLNDLDVSANPVVRIARGSFEGLAQLLHLRLNRLRHLEAVEPRAFRPLNSLRSLSLESPVATRAPCSISDIVASTPALESLSVLMRESTLEVQLAGVHGVRLRAVEVHGAALRHVSARAFASLGNQRALTLRIRGTGVAMLPAGLVNPLARVPHLALDFSNNELVSFPLATLYPNLTGWNRLATKLLPGGLVLSGNRVACGCGVAWAGAWLRRWTAEVGAWGGGARAAARASTCRAGGGAARLPLLALHADEPDCHASALSSRAPTTAPPHPDLPAFLWIVMLYSLS